MRNDRYFSMKLNLDREQDRRVYEILDACPGKAKGGYVKMAVLAYAEKQEIKDALRETLLEVLADGPAALPAAVSTPAKPQPSPAPAETEENGLDLSGDLGFLAGLQNGS